jgi:hypothetical protein
MAFIMVLTVFFSAGKIQAQTNNPPVFVLTESPVVSYGAVKIKFHVDDADRANGLDSALTWKCGLMLPDESPILFVDSARNSSVSNHVSEFYPVYNDTVVLFAWVSDGRLSGSPDIFKDTILTGTAAGQSLVRKTYTPDAWHMFSLPAKTVPLPPVLLASTALAFQWDPYHRNYDNPSQGFTALKRGAGYWLLSGKALSLDVPDTGRLLTAAAACTLVLAEGWNMIAAGPGRGLEHDRFALRLSGAAGAGRARHAFLLVWPGLPGRKRAGAVEELFLLFAQQRPSCIQRQAV